MYIEFDYKNSRYRVPKLSSTQTIPRIPDIEIRVMVKDKPAWQKARHPEKSLLRAARKQYPEPTKVDDRRHFSTCAELDYEAEVANEKSGNA